MGTTVTRTGPVGSAHAMKALNNLLSAGSFMMGIEALLIGQRFGLDPALDDRRDQRIDRDEQQQPEVSSSSSC